MGQRRKYDSNPVKLRRHAIRVSNDKGFYARETIERVAVSLRKQLLRANVKRATNGVSRREQAPNASMIDLMRLKLTLNPSGGYGR